MALKDREPETKYAARLGCRLGRLIDEMSKEDAATITAWLQGDEFSNRAIAAALTAEYAGWQGSGPTVQRHRTGSCGCGSR